MYGIYARKHNFKLRYVLVGWSSCLPAVGCNMMVESSSLQLPPPAVGHKLIYIEKLILYDIIVIYIAQHFIFFLFRHVPSSFRRWEYWWENKGRKNKSKSEVFIVGNREFEVNRLHIMLKGSKQDIEKGDCSICIGSVLKKCNVNYY